MSELAEENEILETLRAHLGPKMLDGKVDRERRISVTVADPVQREVLTFAKEKWGAWHLIAISGVDTQESMAVIYHYDIKPPISGTLAITLNLRVDVDRDNPKVQTITDIAGSSAFFEREAHDLLGIVFEGHPNLERLILPDDWPEGVYPLRKDFLLEIQKEEAK